MYMIFIYPPRERSVSKGASATDPPFAPEQKRGTKIPTLDNHTLAREVIHPKLALTTQRATWLLYIHIIKLLLLVL